ncbi:type IV secretory system conjugative DNA transfer family protein [Nitratireductor alexandrii]|uniref:type IV secretory system conjugative DNA transfer family protein n=1 Tax=Nitratireductor alexandrii TaxID=2448161 RepID=UPI000FD6C7FE|nr:type IV secretory system conjugative DNA transfer family protein [Nitratireductor alexandrii]
MGSHAGGQALAGLLVFLFCRFLDSVGASAALVWAFGGLSALFFLSALWALYGAFQWDRLLRSMKTPTGLYGRTSFPTAAHAEEFGLSFANDGGNGIPVAAVGDRIIYYPGPGHLSIRAPTNAGKTESSAANICFALGAHRNIIATAKGPELAWLCARYRKDVLKQNVHIVGPWQLMQRHGLTYSDFNPVGHLVGYAERKDPALIDKARQVAQILLAEPENGSGENKFFRSLGRDLLAWCLVFLAIQEADTGELCCNLSYLYKMICGSDEELRRFLEAMRACAEFDGSVRRAADRFLGKLTRSPKLGESILSEAADAIQIYEPGGVLARRSEYSDFNPRDLKSPDTPTSIFFEIPPDYIATHGKHFGLCLNTLIDLCIEADRFEPRVTVVADEFANICDGALPAALPTLFLGRSRGVQLVTYVQETESYSRYGREASAFTTQCEVVMAWGIRSTKDAKEYSERSGVLSTMTESGSLPVSLQESGGKYSIGLSEKGVPNFRADEFLHLPDYTAVLFYRQNPPVIVDLVSYRMVEPWRSHATPMPGAPALGEIPVKFKA